MYHIQKKKKNNNNKIFNPNLTLIIKIFYLYLIKNLISHIFRIAILPILLFIFFLYFFTFPNPVYSKKTKKKRKKNFLVITCSEIYW